MTDPSPHDKVADAVHEGQPVEAQYARQGKGGVRVMTVLLISAALVAMGFVLIWAVWSGPLASGRANTGLQDVDAAAFQGEGGDAVPNADAPTTSTGEPTAPRTGEAPNVNAPTTSASPSE